MNVRVESWANVASVPTGSPTGFFSLASPLISPWDINFLIQCHSFPTSKTKIKSAPDHRDQKVWGQKMLN